MNIKPLNSETTENEINAPEIKKEENLDLKTDEALKVFHNEKGFLLFRIIIYLFLFIIISILVVLISTNQFKAMKITKLDFHWSWLILPIIGLTFLFIKLISCFFTLFELNRGIKKFKATANQDAALVMIKIYKKLIFSQVHHNWWAFIVSFYTTIITLIIYGLSKWKLTQEIINNSIPSWVYFYTIIGCILGSIFIIWLIFTIIRKKRIIDISHYFGLKISQFDSFDKQKNQLNRLYLKWFILTFLFLLFLPFLILLIIKKVRKK
ncbi:MSC_0882 family membrane protein [Mesomycoplasma neurolyticum]|uniref:Uncharacterized protein n=1 Tax=Mesomycoplasma neurolyticum TaxID=2120 RepID=A0A449A636_9BACT|nr:hypothetical protein [Mesomycoplasma neurolyticum]VEU59682.1 Uncharacterised protein [Mesomycoplasma neurolyticum]